MTKNPLNSIAIQGTSCLPSIIDGENLAEKQGFEPWDTISGVTHFPGVRLQPLGHLSVKYFLKRTRQRKEIVPSSLLNVNE